MKVKILAPHQTVEGKEVKPGETVEVAHASLARQLIRSGYAAAAAEPATSPDGPQEQAAEPADDQGNKPAQTRKATK